MAAFNRVILIGNLTRDPELRYIPSGTAVTDIGLAVNDRRKGPDGEWAEEATFVDVTLWQKSRASTFARARVCWSRGG
jgi:single-strand DNA-binding protein